MLGGHGFHGCGVAPSEAGEDLAIAKMAGDDFGDVGFPHFAIPNALGINDEDRTFVAETEAAAGGELHLVVEILGGYFVF
jgi:hypothetical protein